MSHRVEAETLPGITRKYLELRAQDETASH